MKKALIYARVSTLEQQRQETIDSQINQLIVFCKEEGLIVIGIYKDRGISANSQDRLDRLDRLVDYLRTHRHEFDVFVFKNTKRLAENVAEYILFKEECRKMGVTMLSLDGYIDFEDDTDEGVKSIRIIKSWVEQQGLKDIARRLLDARREKATLRGIKSQGNCPLGYRYEGSTGKKKHVVLDEQEAEIVKVIFTTFIDTGSTTRTAKIINDMGYRTRGGRQFTKQGIQTILKNDFYKGIVTFNGKKRKGQHEPIISPQLFTKAQKLFK